MLLCCDYQTSITHEEEYIVFAIKQELFSIRTINLPETIQFVKTINVEIVHIM